MFKAFIINYCNDFKGQIKSIKFQGFYLHFYINYAINSTRHRKLYKVFSLKYYL